MKRSLTLLVVLLLAAVPLAAQEEGPATAKGASVNTTGKGYSAAIVVEPATKRILFEENAHVPLPTASMAKMMTLLICMQQIQEGQLKLDTPVTISARASKMGGSQIYAKEGQTFPLQTLIAATMIQSANDAAEAIAEKIAGSAEAFADMMNDKARQMGLKESTFYDPHGLPNSQDPTRVDSMSAYDLAMLGIEVMKFPLLREYAKTPTMPFSNGTFTSGLTNPDHLINPHSRDYFPDATGIKTGYSGPAGYCVTAAATRGSMSLVAVVMGAKASTGPESSFEIASRLMNDAFIHYRILPALKRGATVGQVGVTDGQSKTVAALAGGDVNALVQRGREGSIKVALAPSPVTAPVHAGQQVGWVVVSENGQQINRVPAVAAVNVDKQPWWKKFWPF
ncbi:MAG TPA: D-alanyl-D-alanine carboxypeptidase family protein [Thermoanaerobaculia bacterium]|nr:D-alanyl-D-alanine carboxypeptidase family protein [Thermoanaerobaculia bacterium]